MSGNIVARVKVSCFSNFSIKPKKRKQECLRDGSFILIKRAKAERRIVGDLQRGSAGNGAAPFFFAPSLIGFFLYNENPKGEKKKKKRSVAKNWLVAAKRS